MPASTRRPTGRRRAGQWVLLRYRVGWRAGPWSGCRSGRLGEFGERCGDPRGGRYVEPRFVVAASEVVHEGMPGDNDGRCSVGAQAAHRPRPVCELAVVGFDPVVGVPLDVVARGWDQLVEHARVKDSGVGDDLARRHLLCPWPRTVRAYSSSIR